MSILENARHEAFARAIVEAKSGKDAYIAAGYKPAGAEANASRLMGNDKVAARIAELKEEAAKGSVLTAQQVLEELSKLGRSNMLDYVTIRSDGEPALDFSGLTRDQAAAINEITTETYMDGHGDDAREVKKVKFKLHDKRAALVDLGRHHGLFKDKVEHTGKDGGPIETKEVSDLDAARRIAFMLERAARSATPKEG